MSKRILVVEDEPTNMEIMAGYLEDDGYLIDQAVNGRKAWELLQANPIYDLVITDRRMPEMDGLALAQQMKKNAVMRAIPIIMQTSATAPEEIAEGVKAGVYFYLAKPYEEDTLLTLTRSALREKEKAALFEQRFSRQTEALDTFITGEFHIRTLQEAENIAFLLGSAFPRPELAVNGLYELLLNAIEHGNLGIGYEEKSRLLVNGTWKEEVVRRLQAADGANKKVTVRFAQEPKQISVTIVDQGAGFDWKPFLEIEPSRATRSNGRGIAKANLINFDAMHYKHPGNEVTVSAFK